MVRTCGMSISTASETYKIPRRTIYRHMNMGTATDPTAPTEPIQTEEVPLSTSTPKRKPTQKPEKCEPPLDKPLDRKDVSFAEKKIEKKVICMHYNVGMILLQISKGQFVVVKYERLKKNTKKLSIILYVGQIVEKHCNKFKVKFLVGYKGSRCKFVFPSVEDFDHVCLKKFLRILPKPQIRG